MTDRLFRFLERVLDRTAFPKVADAEAEAAKLAVLRIAVGMILVWRCGLMARDSYYYYEPSTIGGVACHVEALASAVQLLFALGLMIGVAPSTCATALLFTHAAYSAQTMTYNLGPMLLVPIFGMLALLDRGRLSCWARQRPAAPAIQYRLAHFIVFLAFAAWSFAALLNHIRDPFWMEGRTVAAMFSSSYLSEYYGLFRAWELAGPRSYYAVSIVVVCGQTLFQAAMLPLIVTKWGASYVRFWGWVFILGSLGDLQLSVLPLVEVVMWLAVFAPSRWFTWSVRSARSSFAEDSPWRGRALAMYISTFTALFVLFLADAVVPALTQRRLPAWIGQSLIYTGLAAPNVFNRVDLKMGDSWAILV